MYALEDLQIKVRSPRSRRYIDEAVAAYGAAAYRAAIVSIWIAVAADLIDKIRALADSGEGAAIQMRNRLDHAIARRNIHELQKFERELLDKARDDLYLIGPREYTELARLNEDRNLCAHPAYVTGDDDLFYPTAELVRAHLTAAIDGLLAHGPVTGRKAIERFEREIQETTFPSSDDKLTDYLRASYLHHATPSLRANLFKVVCRKTLDPALSLDTRWRCTRAARVFQRLAPQEWQIRAQEVLDRLQQGLPEEQLWLLVSGLCYVPGTWELLHEATRIRIEQLLKVTPAGELLVTHELLRGPLPAGPIAQMLLDRLGDMVATPRARISVCLGDTPDPRLFPLLIDMLPTVGSYTDGENVLRWINALGPALSTDNVRRIVEAALDNDRIYRSSVGINQMQRLGNLADSMGEDERAIWKRWDDLRGKPNPAHSNDEDVIA